MKNKDLQAALREWPDDVDVLVFHPDAAEYTPATVVYVADPDDQYHNSLLVHPAPVGAK